jgi:hypothetical protein
MLLRVGEATRSPRSGATGGFAGVFSVKQAAAVGVADEVTVLPTED